MGQFSVKIYLHTGSVLNGNQQPEVLKRLTYEREASAVSLYDLCFLAGEAWREQFQRVFD